MKPAEVSVELDIWDLFLLSNEGSGRFSPAGKATLFLNGHVSTSCARAAVRVAGRRTKQVDRQVDLPINAAGSQLAQSCSRNLGVNSDRKSKNPWPEGR